jgi:hypothetical protein
MRKKTESNKPNPMNNTNPAADMNTKPTTKIHNQIQPNATTMKKPTNPTKQATTRTRKQPANPSTATASKPAAVPPVAVPRPQITRYRCAGGSKISFVLRPDVPTIEGPFFSKGPMPSFAEQIDALFKTTRNTAHDQGGRITLRMKLPSGRVFTITAEPEGSKQTAEIDRP